MIKKLTPKLGEDEAKDLISFVEESKGEAATKADLQIFATKADLEKQIFSTKADMQTVKADLEKQIQALRTELKVEIQTIKSDLLKWQFGFWATIIIVILIKGLLKL